MDDDEYKLDDILADDYEPDELLDGEYEDEAEFPPGDAAEETAEDPAVTRELKIKSEVYEWATMFTQALVFCVLVFVFCVRVIGVIGDSMIPTLHEDDKIVVSNLFFTPKTGDVVVFRKQSFKNEPLVKRVIATEGQVVDIDFINGIVYVDGIALKEDYINEITRAHIHFVGPQTVPKGMIFVMGDNRNNSTDSRDDRIGFVDKRYVIGKVWLILMPFKDFGVVH